MAFYETKLDPYIPVNPNIDIPAEFLQAEANRLQSKYDKTVLKGQKAAEDSYVQRGVTSAPAADTWNQQYSQQYMDITNKLINAQISSREAADQITALQTKMNTERPMFDILNKLASQEAWTRGYAEQKAALESSNTALTPNFDENTGQFDQQTDLAKLEASYRNLGLTVNPTDWSRIFREQAMNAIVKETTNIDPTSEIVYRDVENDSGGIDRVPFLRTKDGKETRYTRDLIERDLDLNNEALFDQLYKSSRSWGVPHYFATELAGLSEAEARAKFKKDIIQSTTGHWRSTKDEKVTETKVTGVGGGKKKGSGDEEGGDKAVAGVSQAIKLPGVNNPATGQPFKPEDINPRSVSALPDAMATTVRNKSGDAWGAFDSQFPGHATIYTDPETKIPQIIPAPGMQWSVAMKASAEMYNMALQDIASHAEGIAEMNRDIIIDYYGTAEFTPIEQTRNMLTDPYSKFGYELARDKNISLLTYTEATFGGEELSLYGVESPSDQISIKHAFDWMSQNFRDRPEVLKLLNGSGRLRDNLNTLTTLYKETGMDGFGILEEALLADYAQQHDPRYQLYQAAAQEAIQGTDIQEAGTFLPRGAEVQEQLNQAVLTTVASGRPSIIDETGHRLTEDEIKKLQTQLLMTRNGEDGKVSTLFQKTPEARLMFNYSNPNGTDPFATIIYPVIEGKVKKYIIDNIPGLQDLAIEGQVATKPYIQAASEFVKRAESTSWTNSRHNGVYVDISEKGTSGDFNFFLPEAGLAFKATTDEGLFKFIDDMKELNANGTYSQEQIRALALKEGPTYGVRPITENKSAQYVRNLEQKQKIMGKRWNSAAVTGSSVTINPAQPSSNPGTVVITNPNGTEYVSTIKPAAAKALAKTESAPGPEGYDSLYGNSQREGKPFSSIKVTDMTLGEVLAFQKDRSPESYGKWVEKKNPKKKLSAPVGRFQFVGSTLEPLVARLELDLTQKFTPQLQDYLFEEHITSLFEGISSIPAKRQILKDQWEGFQSLSNAELDEIVKEYS